MRGIGALWEDRRVRYLVVGGWNTVFGVLLFVVLQVLLHDVLPYPVVLLIAQVIAVLQAHWSQRTLVWRTTGQFWSELTRFSAVYAGSYFANLALLAGLVEICGWQVIPAQIFVSVVVLVATYLVNRAWTFRVTRPEAKRPAVSDMDQ